MPSAVRAIGGFTPLRPLPLRPQLKRDPLGGPANHHCTLSTMTSALLSRLLAILLINVPLAWLLMSRANHRADAIQTAMGEGRYILPSRYSYGRSFFYLLIVTVCYVVLVEAVAFIGRRDWRRSRSSPPDAGRPTSA